MKWDVTGIGGVADLAGKVIEKIWPDKTEGERQQLAAAVMMVQGQLEINRVEAAHPSILVSGWRPAVGWVCASACAWNWIGVPIAKVGLLLAGYGDVAALMAPANLNEMMPVLLGLLGLGAYRTYEKVQGVASK